MRGFQPLRAEVGPRQPVSDSSRSTPVLILLAVATLLTAPASRAGFISVGCVHNGVGCLGENTVMLNGLAWRHVSAGAQPGGISSSAGGALDHRAGFLQAMQVRQWHLDTDGDGVPNELDWDNDGDGLSDLSELDGSAFDGYAVTDPNNPDTDGDGMSDGDESAGMYNPLDPEHRLEIVRIEIAEGIPRVRWIGKGGGRINTVESAEDLSAADPWTVLHSAPHYGGSAPWFATTNNLAWPPDIPIRHIRIRTEP